MVTAPNHANTSRQEFHLKAELEKACLAEAGRRFTQDQHMPLLSSPLLEIFGERGKFKAVTSVLMGTFIPPSLSDLHAKKILSCVAKPPNIADCAPRTLSEYCYGWRKAHETTSSSASGIHFGHYIAGTFNPEIMVVNANIPLQTGFLYQRWQTGLNIMIEKTMGDFNVKKLRIILLFKADFNVNNKWIGSAVMYQAEQNHFLAEEQYGSQKFKLAIHQCLNKCLLYDLICFKRQPAALCSNDAKSCYDRITLFTAALCLCMLGCPFTAADSMITTIHEMNHHVRTMYGDSKTSASRASWQAPITGIGQGNGAGPHIWAAVSSPMFDIMRLDGFYAHIITSIL